MAATVPTYVANIRRLAAEQRIDATELAARVNRLGAHRDPVLHVSAWTAQRWLDDGGPHARYIDLLAEALAVSVDDLYR